MLALTVLLWPNCSERPLTASNRASRFERFRLAVVQKEAWLPKWLGECFTVIKVVVDVGHISLSIMAPPSMRWWPKDTVAEPPAAYSLLWTQGRWRNSKAQSAFEPLPCNDNKCIMILRNNFWANFLNMTKRLFPIRVAEETEGVAGHTVEERWWKQRRNHVRILCLSKAWIGLESIHLKRIYKLSHGQVLPSCLINHKKATLPKPTAYHSLFLPPKKFFVKIWFNHKPTLNSTKWS